MKSGLGQKGIREVEKVGHWPFCGGQVERESRDVMRLKTKRITILSVTVYQPGQQR